MHISWLEAVYCVGWEILGQKPACTVKIGKESGADEVFEIP